MNEDTARQLGEYLRRGREAKGLSTRQLSSRIGFDQALIVRLEGGIVKRPRVEVLAALADELSVPLGDLYALADHTVPKELPTFAPYLRAKYRDLPPAAASELEEAFGRVAAKYGYDGDGPKPGEDEG